MKTEILISTPKSASSIRTISMPEDIACFIRNLPVEKKGFLLTCSEKHYIEPRTMQNHFKRVLKSAGIRDMNFHVLRHTFATRCVKDGFDIKALSEILGHSNVNITMNRYVHPTMEQKRLNMQRLSCPFATYFAE